MAKFLLRDGYQIAESTTDIFYDDQFKGWKLTIEELPNIFTDFDQTTYTVSETIGNPLPVEEPTPTETTTEVTNGAE